MTILRVLQGTRAAGRFLTSFLSTRVDNPGLTMIGQSKISSFFSSSQQKRKAESDQVTLEKKIKSRDENVPENIPSTPPSSSPVEAGGLTPEQKKMIDEKKLVAKAKLLQKTSHGLVTNIGHTWLKALEPEFSKPYFQQLCKFVSGEREKHTIFPPADEVFSWTQLCEIKQVKVVILGQDPYHGPGQAHGLCFSVKQGIQPPPSLENMYKELGNDIEGFSHPGHGTLSGWATQGVLLLNACLTVRARNANSHAGKGWEKFTDAVISWLNKNQAGVVFILWGAYAQKKGACIDKKKHHILKGVHPSPLSAHRGFFGSKHFSTCNKLLKEQGKKPIDWCHLPRTK